MRVLLLWSLFLFSFDLKAQMKPFFTAETADEVMVRFSSVFETEWSDLQSVKSLNPSEKETYKQEYVLSTLKYVFGPLTNRQWGSPQRGFKADIKWNEALIRNGKVYLPYHYQATWIVHKNFLRGQALIVPVPLTANALETRKWKNCAGSSPDHHSMEVFWYYWDPERSGCDHVEGREYVNVKVEMGYVTPNQNQSYPEYGKMLQDSQFNMTFAFGYVKTPANPNPDSDNDFGVEQYRDFLDFVRRNTSTILKESVILQKEYGLRINPDKVMGRRFTGTKNGVQVTINVVAAADVDQMEIFAKSFASDHDDFFAWFGHSRVGWGFDSDQLLYKLRENPRRYSITPQYQMIYWAGCNSYSYYTLPFFQMKVNQRDSIGTKGLDIISNGLPSYFALNSTNAKVVFRHLLMWERRATYQQIIADLEGSAARLGLSNILINVLGDEDNPRN